jgi:5-methylcytosine-specific restriction protein A
MENREFRTPESYGAEHVTRKMVSPFLTTKGFAVASDSFNPSKKSQTQTIEATDPTGQTVRIRVKLCWRPRESSVSKITRYAAQLIAKIKNGDWDGSIKGYVERARRDRITHFAFIVREGAKISHAALMPVSELAPIWYSQRDISAGLIRQGKLGRRKKNHAMNGSSPTLWLKDDEAQEVVDALWKHLSVQDIVQMRIAAADELSESAVDDTFDDLPVFDYILLGSDGAPRVLTQRSSVRRDQRVRAEVLRRAAGACERTICGATRNYPGFFDVHHILGADVSDRVYNCVALCPNCHREAHFAPNRDAINKDLLEFAMRFKRE